AAAAAAVAVPDCGGGGGGGRAVAAAGVASVVEGVEDAGFEVRLLRLPRDDLLPRPRLLLLPAALAPSPPPPRPPPPPLPFPPPRLLPSPTPDELIVWGVRGMSPGIAAPSGGRHSSYRCAQAGLRP
ncbi:unnamed protein product, partial [Ectocarpus sp. 12 AP-2014]